MGCGHLVEGRNLGKKPNRVVCLVEIYFGLVCVETYGYSNPTIPNQHSLKL